MCDDSVSHFDAWIGLAGVVVGTFMGFVLSAVRDIWKDWRSNQSLMHALKAELRINLSMVPIKQQIVAQSQTAIKQNAVPAVQGVPFLRSVYDANVPKISAFTPVEELNLLHNIYWRLRIIDDAEIALTSNKYPISDPHDYVKALTDYLLLFSVTAKLIKGYLDGVPVRDLLDKEPQPAAAV